MSEELKYVNSIKLRDWTQKFTNLVGRMDELKTQVQIQRDLRYIEVDIEAKRASGEMALDELYIPQHIIDSNIRREQPSYVQYVTSSNRAVVLSSNSGVNSSTVEKDFTNRVRFPGWQTSMYANIDAMQQNGWSVMEVAFENNSLAHKHVAIGDFGIADDSKDLQSCELVVKAEYFSRTELLDLVEQFEFNKTEINNLLDIKPDSNDEHIRTDKSLYRIFKLMFRVKGVVHVGWAHKGSSIEWLRVPKPLFLGRRAAKGEAFEKDYPYFMFAYAISENPTLTAIKGRAFLDQDCQQAVTSLMSSFCTAHRRGSGVYFSVDTDEPNNDQAMQKNVFFKPGALINKKIKQFQLSVPDAGTLSAIQALITSNMQETSKVNFAAMNRKDSEKTATEINAAVNSAATLSTVQVVLFSSSLRALFQLMFDIIQSRVVSGVVSVAPELAQLYQLEWSVKPAGDVDVIEKQQNITAMTNAWPIMQNTPAAEVFLADIISAMFPESASKYLAAIAQAKQLATQQQQSAAEQQKQAGMQMAQSIIKLAERPDMFSDKGQLHALPALQQAAEQIKAMMGAKQ